MMLAGKRPRANKVPANTRKVTLAEKINRKKRPESKMKVASEWEGHFIPKAVFIRMIRDAIADHAKNKASPNRVTAEFASNLQMIMEAKVVKLFQASTSILEHEKKTTLTHEHLDLVVYISSAVAIAKPLSLREKQDD